MNKTQKEEDDKLIDLSQLDWKKAGEEAEKEQQEEELMLQRRRQMAVNEVCRQLT